MFVSDVLGGLVDDDDAVEELVEEDCDEVVSGGGYSLVEVEEEAVVPGVVVPGLVDMIVEMEEELSGGG